MKKAIAIIVVCAIMSIWTIAPAFAVISGTSVYATNLPIVSGITGTYTGQSFTSSGSAECWITRGSQYVTPPTYDCFASITAFDSAGNWSGPFESGLTPFSASISSNYSVVAATTYYYFRMCDVPFD